MNKKTIVWSVVIVIVLSITLYVGLLGQSNALNFCVYSNNGNKLCFGQESSSNALSIVAVNSAGQSSVKPGDVTYVKIYTELPRALHPPIYTAQVLLRDPNNAVLDIWDVKAAISQQSNIASCLSGFGSCVSVSVTGTPGQIMTFTAPTSAGTYTIEYVLKDTLSSIGSVLVDESTPFVVATPATVCPKSTCGSWTTTQSITNGAYQQRSCVIYDSGCSGKTNYEYRTSCNSGFLFGSTSNSQGTGYGSCVAQPVVQQPTPDQTQNQMTDNATTTTNTQANAIINGTLTQDPTQTPTPANVPWYQVFWNWLVAFFTVN